MKFQDVDTKIALYINESSERFLSMYIQDEVGERFANRIFLNPELLRTINLSAEFFKIYADPRCVIRDPDGIVKPKLQSQQETLPISVSELPEFEEEKCYHLRIENDGEGLKATFVEIID
ncbi:MAG: hypothetical protein WAM28_06020 [Chlamydiales bacterium]